VIEGDSATRLRASVNGQDVEVSLDELCSGARSFYTAGFVSPALCFHRAVPASDYERQFTFLHRHQSTQRDWYTVRVKQRNNQWAWSSPIWIEGKAT
jgi:hypothetical protein